MSSSGRSSRGGSTRVGQGTGAHGGHDDDDESDYNLYKPDAWKVALEATYEKPAPSAQIKAAARRLVLAELFQQATGWLLLTQMGVLLGSFGQLMPAGVCLLSLAIFMLEAILKFVRNWAHRSYFMDVPCAYVPLHEATHDALSNFELSLKLVLPLELALYTPYIYFVIQFLTDAEMCEKGYFHYCQEGDTATVWLTLLCGATVLLHGLTNVVAWLAFNAAMRNNLAYGVSGRLEQHRVLCLTWWVHLARHQHLSAVVANKEPMNCGLPGHWFETADQLKVKLRECVENGMGDHVINSEGPLWDSLTMALNAIVCLANKGSLKDRTEILRDDGFDLLIRVVREGKFPSCRGLAAAAIGIFVRSPEALAANKVALSAAIIPLKRLARSKEHELKEVALGALLNIVLNDHQLEDVLEQFDSKDGIVSGHGKAFMLVVMETAYSGPTTRCQELAIGLLQRLAGKSKDARDSLFGENLTKNAVGGGGITSLIELLKYGLTAEIKASAAGVLAELAVNDNALIAKGPDIELCIDTLFQALDGEPRLAYPSLRALSNLAKGMKTKKTITAKGAISKVVGLLKEKCWELSSGPQVHGEGMSVGRAQATSVGRAQATSISRAQATSVITQEQVRAEAARVLWVLSYRNEEFQKTIAREGAIPLLVELFENPQPKVYIHAIQALTGTAWRSRANQDRIAAFGDRIMPRLVQILKDKNDKQDEKGIEKVTLAILSLAENHKRIGDMLTQNGALDVLGNIARRRDLYKGKAVERTDKALKLLSEKLNE